MKLKAQIKTVGNFTEEQKRDGSGTYLALPVTFKIGENKRYVITDQNTGATELRTFDELFLNRFIGQNAQNVANLNLQVGEVVDIELRFNVNNQYLRTDIDVINVSRPQPAQSPFGA